MRLWVSEVRQWRMSEGHPTTTVRIPPCAQEAREKAREKAAQVRLPSVSVEMVRLGGRVKRLREYSLDMSERLQRIATRCAAVVAGRELTSLGRVVPPPVMRPIATFID